MKKKKLLESDFIKDLKKFFKEHNVWVYKTNERFASGFPDLIVIHNGTTHYIEAKVGTNDLTPLQEKTLTDIAQAGGNAYVFRRYDEGDFVRSINYNGNTIYMAPLLLWWERINIKEMTI